MTFRSCARTHNCISLSCDAHTIAHDVCTRRPPPPRPLCAPKCIYREIYGADAYTGEPKPLQLRLRAYADGLTSSRSRGFTSTYANAKRRVFFLVPGFKPACPPSHLPSQQPGAFLRTLTHSLSLALTRPEDLSLFSKSPLIQLARDLFILGFFFALELHFDLLIRLVYFFLFSFINSKRGVVHI